MRAHLVLTPFVLVLSLAACDQRVRITTREDTTSRDAPIRAVDDLNCPEHQGELIRTTVAADGLSCEYAGPRGAEVSLRLVRLAETGSARAALAPLEQELRLLMPGTIERAGAGGDGTVVSIQSEDGRSSVRLPGLSVESDGDSSSVNIGGVRIRGRGTPEENRDAGETVSVSAQNNAAEIRALSEAETIRATYVLVDEEASERGWRRVGYEARGPSGGPLVVAVVHSKDHQEGDIFDQAEALVTLNVGGTH